MLKQKDAHTCVTQPIFRAGIFNWHRVAYAPKMAPGAMVADGYAWSIKIKNKDVHKEKGALGTWDFKHSNCDTTSSNITNS